MEPRQRNAILLGLAGAIVAMSAAYALRGFTVDDAWIPARYAAHVASGLGYRWNPHGKATDGVTPLPWVPILVLASGFGGVRRAWMAARVLGFFAFAGTGALLGREVARVPGSRLRVLALLPLALSAPMAAWSTAGLETPLAMLLVTIGLVAEAPLQGALAIGLATTLRPELLPMALVLGIWRGGRTSKPGLASAMAIGPWLLVVSLRVLLFGRGFPLATLAKPSDTDHGLIYVVRGLLLTGAPILAFAPLGIFRRPELLRARWLCIAFAAHCIAVTLAGGDWMPWWRLLVPAMPLLIVAAIDIAAVAHVATTWSRAVLASAAMIYAWRLISADAVRVVSVREGLIALAPSALARAHVVAALDVGWVAASSELPIVDLAGLTDQGIASLPGGHTSKHVSATQLAARNVDTFLFLRQRGCTGECLREDGGPYDREVEERLAGDEWLKQNFVRSGELTSADLTYVVWTKR